MENYQEYFKQAEFVVKYLTKRLTKQEMVELEVWLSENEQNRTLFKKLTEEYVIGRKLEEFRLPTKDEDWKRIVSETGFVRKRKFSYIYERWFKYAAAVFFICSLAAVLYQYKQVNSPIGKKQQAAVIVPGGNKAVLILEDGKHIVLDDASKGEIARQSNMVITKTGDGQLIYDTSGKTAHGQNKRVQYNILTTPRGGQYSIVLPDGSKVWLNAASSLRYPTKFDENSRLVELNGEAYFEIAPLRYAKKGKRVPFRVISGDHIVEVLGTHFNVSSYSDEKIITTTLLEGKVKVIRSQKVGPLPKRMEVMLKPGEQSVISLREVQAAKGISVRPANTEETVAWKNGQFQFKDADLPTIMRQIARWYDVDVEFQGKIPEEKFRGKISRGVPISQLFQILQTSGVDFKTEGRKIIIKS